MKTAKLNKSSARDFVNFAECGRYHKGQWRRSWASHSNKFRKTQRQQTDCLHPGWLSR